MNLLEAMQKVEQNENVRKLRGYYLGSVFSSIIEKQEITEWTFLYYNPTSKMVVDCFVAENLVTVGEETPAIKDMQELDLKKVKTGIEEAMETVKKKFNKSSLNTLISLHNKQFDKETKTVWTIAFVTPEMSAISYDIDAGNGQVLNETTTNLLRRM